MVGWLDSDLPTVAAALMRIACGYLDLVLQVQLFRISESELAANGVVERELRNEEEN